MRFYYLLYHPPPLEDFQFSLWDSQQLLFPAPFFQSTLSILFMRFEMVVMSEYYLEIIIFQFSLWDSQPIQKQSEDFHGLSILFMRFHEFTIEILEGDKFFQFSLWDSLSLLAILGCIIFSTFNSLYEIRIKSYYNLWWRKWNFQFSLWDSYW